MPRLLPQSILLIISLIISLTSLSATKFTNPIDETLVYDSWFFIVPIDKQQAGNEVRTTRTEVYNDEDFGFGVKYKTDKKNIKVKITLKVPNNPKNFPCRTCAPGELKIIDKNTVIVEISQSTTKGEFAWYWGIGKEDPRGKYSIKVELDGRFTKSWDFVVK